jgi:hypothetical protein
MRTAPGKFDGAHRYRRSLSPERPDIVPIDVGRHDRTHGSPSLLQPDRRPLRHSKRSASGVMRFLEQRTHAHANRSLTANNLQNLERSLARKWNSRAERCGAIVAGFVRRDILICSEALNCKCSVNGLRVIRCSHAQSDSAEQIRDLVFGFRLNKPMNRRSITMQRQNQRYVVVLSIHRKLNDTP